MQFAVMVWVGSDDSAKIGSIFGIVDEANPGALPTLSPKRRRVAGVMARSQASGSRAATKVVVTPKRGSV